MSGQRIVTWTDERGEERVYTATYTLEQAHEAMLACDKRHPEALRIRILDHVLTTP